MSEHLEAACAHFATHLAGIDKSAADHEREKNADESHRSLVARQALNGAGDTAQQHGGSDNEVDVGRSTTAGDNPAV